jgi:hypothetical protein
MKVTIDNVNKTLQLHEPTKVGDLLDFLINIGIEGDDYSIIPFTTEYISVYPPPAYPTYSTYTIGVDPPVNP